MGHTLANFHRTGNLFVIKQAFKITVNGITSAEVQSLTVNDGILSGPDVILFLTFLQQLVLHFLQQDKNSHKEYCCNLNVCSHHCQNDYQASNKYSERIPQKHSLFLVVE